MKLEFPFFNTEIQSRIKEEEKAKEDRKIEDIDFEVIDEFITNKGIKSNYELIKGNLIY